MGRRGAAIVMAIGLALLAAPIGAHWDRPEDVIARIAAPASREALGVVGAARDPRLARLLIVHVSASWRTVDPARRVTAAEQWWSAWRHAVPQGIVAILEQGTDRPLVNYGAGGRAVLRDGNAAGARAPVTRRPVAD